MTFGIRHVVGGLALRRGDTAQRQGFFGTKQPLFGANWQQWKLCSSLLEADGWTMNDVWTYTWGAHASHALDLGVTLLCYWLFYSSGSWLVECREWRIGWVSSIFLFNLACEVIICNFWHYFNYVSDLYKTLVKRGIKHNPTNQYEPQSDEAGMLTSSTGQLEREITFTTLGWLQSALWQCIFTNLWAKGALPMYANFFEYPAYSLFLMWFVAYWREIHFYCAHRGMHPWWDRENGLLSGDVGAFLYRHVHSLHHKSYNPGPWSGLSMHPVEHFLYYSCATLPPLFISVHPLHFLYTKFHADIAPIGGHSGMDEPVAGSDYHYLHHAKFECNYGVPFPVNLDKIFGTWVEWETYKKTGEMKVNAWTEQQMHDPDDVVTSLLKAGQKQISLEELAQHSKPGDYFIALYGQVIDISNFISKHPGGEKILVANAGKDATQKFESIHAASGGFSLVSKWCPESIVASLIDWKGPAAPELAVRKYPGSLMLWPAVALFAMGSVASGL